MGTRGNNEEHENNKAKQNANLSSTPWPVIDGNENEKQNDKYDITA